ncbi:MAG: hypothetical protein AAF721_39440 [Myxococcota bacterium]
MVPAELAAAIVPADDPNYTTAAALLHRIDGNSCTGCHRQRAIEGFHLPGEGGPHALLSGVSPHLSNQQPWRRSYVAAVAAGTTVESRRPLHNAGDGASGQHCSLASSPVSTLHCKPDLQCREAPGFAFGFCAEPGVGPAPCTTASEHCAAPSRWFPGGLSLQRCSDGDSCAAVIRPSDFRRCRGESDRWSCAASGAETFELDRCDADTACRDGYVCVGNEDSGHCSPTAGLAEFRLYSR